MLGRGVPGIAGLRPQGCHQGGAGVTLPEDFTIEVHEEMQDTSHLVLPPTAGLNEAELQRATGGTGAYFWHAPLATAVDPSVDTG